MQHRDRKHAEYHERRLEQQMLDALLRIEEILARASPEAPPAPRGNYEDRVTPETEAKPIATPFAKAIVKEREDVLDPDGHKVGSVPKGKRR